MSDILNFDFRWHLVLQHWNGGRRIKSRVIYIAGLAILLQIPTPTLAVTWPIERRYFDDKTPDRQPGPDDVEKSWTDLVTGIGFVFLPSGCFDMGDSEVGIVGQICVNGFFLSQHEITNAQFRRFRSAHDSGSHLGHTLDDDDQPVVNVSWSDATAFAAWLTNETGTPIRLATEAEWEYACRQGWLEASTKDVSAFGNLRGSQGEVAAETHGTVAVGSYQAGPNKLHDMHGNASEWVLDSYVEDADRYGANRDDPRIENEAVPLRVRRGGSWGSSVSQSRCAARDYYLGELAVPHTGFRLVAKPK